MKLKFVIIAAFSLLASLGIQAQNLPPSATVQKDIESKTMLFSLNLGVGSFISEPAPLPDLDSYGLEAPIQNWFDQKPILNIEGKYFFSTNWGVKLGLGFAYNVNPGQEEKPGLDMGGDDAILSIPTYRAVPKSDNLQYSILTGVDRYLSFKNNHVRVRIGAEVGFAHGIAKTKGDPEKYLGRAVGEALSLRLAPVVGAEYFFASALFVGLEVRPFNYQYSMYSIKPRSGLAGYKANSHTYNIFAMPSIKFGVFF